MARSTIPNDLVPFGAGTINLTSIDVNGQPSTNARSFPRLLISSNVSTTRESEELETGEGADITMTTSEKQTVEVVLNAYNKDYHALTSGREVTTTVTAAPKMTDLLVSVTGTATFATGEEPVPFTTGRTDYNFVVSDFRGVALQLVEAVEDVVVGTYHYDATTKTITVDEEYADEYLNVIYFVTGTDAYLEQTTEVLQTPVFILELWSTLQSPSTGQKFLRYQRISRCSVDGDLPEPANQKDINQNMTYNYASQTPAIGERAYINVITVM